MFDVADDADDLRLNFEQTNVDALADGIDNRYPVSRTNALDFASSRSNDVIFFRPTSPRRVLHPKIAWRQLRRSIFR